VWFLKNGTPALNSTFDFRSAIHSLSNAILEFGLKYSNCYKFFWRREYTDDQNGEPDIVMVDFFSNLRKLLMFLLMG
jgi:hypothetical protein